MNKVYIFLGVLVAILAIFITLQFRPQQTVPNAVIEPNADTLPSETQSSTQSTGIELAIETDVNASLAAKYKKLDTDVQVYVEKETETHATGTVRFANEGGGAVWFAVKEGTWKVVFDGQSAIPCTISRQYNFPATIVEQCS
jgi:hypothetical protein